jgi:hypothetical protein
MGVSGWKVNTPNFEGSATASGQFPPPIFVAGGDMCSPVIGRNVGSIEQKTNDINVLYENRTSIKPS